MIHDILAQFADAVSVANGAGTDVIGSQIDLAHVGSLRNIGDGRPVYLVIQVTTSIITGGDAGTLRFELVSDSVEALTSSPTVHIVTESFVTDGVDATTLLAGARIVVALPIDADYERYLGVQTVIATQTVTAGAIDAFLTLDPPTNTFAYPQGSVA